MKRNTATKWTLPPFKCERCGIPSYGYCMRCFQLVAQFAEQERAMKRIKVPDEMLKAARRASSELKGNRDDAIVASLEAALLWLSEHPQVPTDEQAHELYLRTASSSAGTVSHIQNWIAEWQRRCFVQEEPEIPAEIEDLLDTDDAAWMGTGTVKEALIEAYRRGLTRGSVALRKGEHK